jgi:hypothetical protein
MIKYKKKTGTRKQGCPLKEVWQEAGTGQYTTQLLDILITVTAAKTTTLKMTVMTVELVGRSPCNTISIGGTLATLKLKNLLLIL